MAELNDQLKCVWELQNKKGKPISLHIGAKSKAHEYEINNLTPGAYLLFAHTTAVIPGGKHGPRYIAVDVNAKDLDGTVLLHDVYKIHAKEKTLAVEFSIAEGHAGVLFLHFRLNAPVGPMKVMAKLFQNTQKTIIQHESELDEEIVYRSLTIQGITLELERQSDVREKALEDGMIRPFLLLASMHPVARQQVADYLGIALIGEKEFGDPHQEAYKLCSKNRKGLQACCSHSWETLNPVMYKHSVNWYQCLYRVMTEIYKKDMNHKDEIKNVRSTEMATACKTSSNQEIPNMEMKLLSNIAHTFEDSQKKDEEFHRKVDELCASSQVQNTLFKNLRSCGIDQPEIHRFVIGFSLYLLTQKDIEQDDEKGKLHKLRTKEADKEIKENQQKAHREEKAMEKGKDVEFENKHEEFMGNHQYRPFHYEASDAEFVESIKEQLLEPVWDPRNTSQKGAGAAKKVIIFVGKKYLKKYIIPLFPPLTLPYLVYSLIHGLIGSKHEKLYIAVVQLLLQRLLLAAHGIEINSYY